MFFFTILIFLAFFAFATVVGYIIYQSYYAPPTPPPIFLPKALVNTGETTADGIPTIDQETGLPLTREEQIAELERLIKIYETEELPYFRQRIKQARIDLSFARQKVNEARYHQDGPPMPGSTLAVADSLLSSKLNLINQLLRAEDTRKQELQILKDRLNSLKSGIPQ